jgi:hypothetical protein
MERKINVMCVVAPNKVKMQHSNNPHHSSRDNGTAGNCNSIAGVVGTASGL